MALSDDQIRNALERYSSLGPKPMPEPPRDGLPDLRRGRRRPPRRPPGRVELVEIDGLLQWDWGFGPARRRSPMERRRRGARRGGPAGRELFAQVIEPLGVNQIGQFLLDFDRERNPAVEAGKGWKLRQWDANGEVLSEPAPPSKPGKVLLVVHGTASCCDHIFGEIRETPEGKKLLADAARHYAAVLAFEHPTLAFSPMLNALDLAAAVEPYGDRGVDIVCHSRGGLVSSWWMHLVDRSNRAKRCVFVGSPLQGTTLANPAKLRQSLNLLASYGKLLGDLGQATGFLALPFTILRVACSVVDFTASVPLLDAALAMIPGLNAQSKTDNNYELARLNLRMSPGAEPPTQFYVQANFNPKDPDWKIWQYATDSFKLRAANAAVDMLVFSGKNDLVVDTDSMISKVGGLTHTFEGEDQVHHTNYFRQLKTVELIRVWLGIP